MSVSKPTRRHVVGGLATLGVCGLIGTSASKPAAGADIFTVGFVFIGPRIDWGWNQSFAAASDAIGALEGVNVVEAAYLPESTDYSGKTLTGQTADYIKALERLIKSDGARLIFSTSIDDDPILAGVAKEHPEILFRHISDFGEPSTPANVGSQNALIFQGHYVNGVAAGLSTSTNKLGFVAGEAVGPVLLNVNSFLLGCRHTNPRAIVQIQFTKGWESPDLEATAVNTLVDAGCDVITCHLDSPKTVVETAEARGAKTCGHAYNQGSLAPNGYITGADYAWAGMYTDFVEMARAGKTLPRFITGGYDKGYVASSPFGAGATPAAIQAAKAAMRAMKNGEPVFVGPIKDNKGKVVIAAGTQYGAYAPELQKTDYLIDGIVGLIE